jgi:hypothetical protein
MRMAIPVIRGVKTKAEEFVGILRSSSIEAMMLYGLALLAGTSHAAWAKTSAKPSMCSSGTRNASCKWTRTRGKEEKGRKEEERALVQANNARDYLSSSQL